MSVGLSNKKKEELRFINHLIQEVKGFDCVKLNELEKEYKEVDKDIYNILKVSRERAKDDYSQYLDKKVLQISYDFGVGFEGVEINLNDPIGKTIEKMREEAFDDKEFLTHFLSRSLTKTSVEYDKTLRISHKKQQREAKNKRNIVSWIFGR